MGVQSNEAPRRGFRFPAAVPAMLHEGGRSVPCAAQDLSRTGVLLVGPFARPETERVDLTLKAVSGTHQVRMRGRVVRVEPDDEPGNLRIAVEFVELDEAQKDALEIVLARFLEYHPPPGSLESLNPGTPLHEVRRVLESIPLPQRISLAARASQKEREYLRQDQNAAVLDSMVKNPSLTLEEALLLASSTFITGPTIELLAADSRFNRDESLRMALATNARITFATADRITADFKPPQIRKLLAKSGVSQALRDKLVRKLARG
jgi:PilZ domain-containing protein